MNPYPVNTDLPASKSPLAWATVGNGILFTAQIPMDVEGKVVAGGIEPRSTIGTRVSTYLVITARKLAIFNPYRIHFVP